MLRVIRRFKKFQIPDDRTKGYLIYTITEFVIVILGILIALQINNWNSNRKEKKLEVWILNEFLTELSEELNESEFATNYHQTFLNSTQIVLDHIINNKPYNDSLSYHFGHIYGTTIASTKSATYESLMSIGIDLIKDDKIRANLASLYDVQYNYLAALEESEQKFMQEHLYNSITEELDIIKLYEKAMPINYSEIHKNNKFIQDLKMSMNVKEYIINSNKRINKMVKSLIADIEEYLK